MKRLLEDIAFELRSPVNTILGFAEILQRLQSSAIDDERQRHAEILLETSRRLSGFISDLSDFARIERGVLSLSAQDMDAAELVATALGSCHAAAEESRVDILACLQDGIELRCDAARISRVIVALVNRAIAASPSGAVVSLVFEHMAAGLALVIKDRGVPVLPEQRESLFEPDMRRNGLDAMALPVAKRIALLHGGDIMIESNPGRGTTAMLILPASRVCKPARIDSRLTCTD